MFETGQPYRKTENVVDILHVNKKRLLQTYLSHFTFMTTHDYVLNDACGYVCSPIFGAVIAHKNIIA
jgi:hypothetical protein